MKLLQKLKKKNVQKKGQKYTKSKRKLVETIKNLWREKLLKEKEVENTQSRKDERLIGQKFKGTWLYK